MQVIIISECLIIREGIKHILLEENFIEDINTSHLYTDIHKSNYDLIIVDLNKNNSHYLSDIKLIKEKLSTKVMILDFYEDKSLFNKCLKVGVDGYILANIDSEDIGYAVKKLHKGKKYYDAGFIENYIVADEPEYAGELTKREKEILICIARGKSNTEISKELYITEHTVKKHTSNIFSKLNLKDRMQAALYVYNNGILAL